MYHIQFRYLCWISQISTHRCYRGSGENWSCRHCRQERYTFFYNTIYFLQRSCSCEQFCGMIAHWLMFILFSPVFVKLACAFHYGREDLDVIGLSFRKDIWVKHIQLYPDAGHKPNLTPMHGCLLKKAGEQGRAFTFDIATNLPCSVTLQPGPDNAGKVGPCLDNLFFVFTPDW